MYTTRVRSAAARRDWMDGFRVGPVTLRITAAGPYIGWELFGPLAALTGAERMELATLFARFVDPGRDCYVRLFPDRGGLNPRRTGVAYVGRN